MSVSFGVFLTCFMITLFLTVYLHLLIHRTPAFFERTIKFSIIGILIILIRMVIPINFPFTHTIYSYQVLPRIIDFTTTPVPNTNWVLSDLFIGIISIVAIILLIRFVVQHLRLHNALSQFYVKGSEKYAYLYECISNYYKKPVQIAVIPQPISPAITGLVKPVLILPDTTNLTPEELKYICQHEIMHYKKHHILFVLIMEIVCRIHWWNPCVQYLKKEFALFLELTNDFFLIYSAPQFDTLNYADLILKTAKNIHSGKRTTPSFLMNFAINNSSILTTRINFILNNQRQIKHKSNIYCTISNLIISIAVFCSIFFVIEADFEVLEPLPEDIVEIREDNAYLIKNENGYLIYVDGEYFAEIDHLPDEFKNIQIYEEGDIPNEN